MLLNFKPRILSILYRKIITHTISSYKNIVTKHCNSRKGSSALINLGQWVFYSSIGPSKGVCSFKEQGSDSPLHRKKERKNKDTKRIKKKDKVYAKQIITRGSGLDLPLGLETRNFYNSTAESFAKNNVQIPVSRLSQIWRVHLLN